MHLGVLTTSYPRFPGDAAGNFVAGLNRFLLRAGHTVEVLCAAEPGAPPPPTEPGVTVHPLPSPLFYHGGAPDALAGAGPAALLHAARFSLALLRAAARLGRCDALISHWLVPCGAIACAVAGGRPHLAIAHSSDIHLLRRLRGQALVRLIAQKADLVYTARSLVVPGAQGRVVPMGIDAAAFAPPNPDDPDERAQARARLGLDPQRPTALFLGRLVPVKGLDHLLAALPAAPGWDLLVGGDGPERQRLGTPPGVRFLGQVGPALRRDLLLSCDLLVLPSLKLPDGRTEGSPTVIMEALAARCPIVASDVGGVADLLGPAGCPAGLLLPPGDVPALQAALRAALDPAWRAAARAAAAEQAPRHDWARIGPMLLASILPA